MPPSQRRPLASWSDSMVRHCELSNCATIVTIRHLGINEAPPSIPVQGSIRRQPPFGPYDPRVPPVNQPSFLVQRHAEVWEIEVRRRDGSVQWIRQSYPVLFVVGDEVLVEAGGVRAAD